VGLDHTEAGALVTAKWNLATDIQDVIKGHHDDDGKHDGSDERPLACVRLADSVAHELGLGYLPNRASFNPARDHDLAAVGLDSASWSAVRDEIAVGMEEAVMALGNLSS